MRTLVALVAIVFVLVGCGGGDGDTGPTTTATSTLASITAGETTASTSAGTPTTSTPTTAPPVTARAPTAFSPTAADAITELKAAWEAGDRPRAAAIAPDDVVEALFVVPAGGFEVYGCDTGEFPTSTCDFRNRSTGTFIKVGAKRTDGRGWQVSTIDVGSVGG